MSKLHLFRDFVNDRLARAALEIFGLYEKTLAESEEEIWRSKENSAPLRRVPPEIRLQRADVQHLCLSEPSQIKEEQWAGHWREELLNQHSDNSAFVVTSPAGKTHSDPVDESQLPPLDQTPMEEDGERDRLPADSTDKRMKAEFYQEAAEQASDSMNFSITVHRPTAQSEDTTLSIPLAAPTTTSATPPAHHDLHVPSLVPPPTVSSHSSPLPPIVIPHTPPPRVDHGALEPARDFLPSTVTPDCPMDQSEDTTLSSPHATTTQSATPPAHHDLHLPSLVPPPAVSSQSSPLPPTVAPPTPAPGVDRGAPELASVTSAAPPAPRDCPAAASHSATAFRDLRPPSPVPPPAVSTDSSAPVPAVTSPAPSPWAATPSPDPVTRSRKRGRPSGGLWERTFFCCALVSTDTIPTPEEAVILQNSGLGRKFIQFPGNGSAADVKAKMEEAFPALCGVGGFKLMRCFPDRRLIELPVPPGGYTVASLKYGLNRAVAYVVPIQNDLNIQETLAPEDEDVVKETCQTCGQEVPIHILVKHISRHRRDEQMDQTKPKMDQTKMDPDETYLYSMRSMRISLLHEYMDLLNTKLADTVRSIRVPQSLTEEQFKHFLEEQYPQLCTRSFDLCKVDRQRMVIRLGTRTPRGIRKKLGRSALYIRPCKSKETVFSDSASADEETV